MNKPITDIDTIIIDSLHNGKNSVDDILALRINHNLDIFEISNSIARLEEYGIIIQIRDKFIILDHKRI